MADDEIDCERALVELHEFLDGELTVERRRTIEMHLHACQHCFSSFDFEQELRLVVRTRLRIACPASLEQRIAALIALEAGGLNTSDLG